jgi:hypothetical protein
MPVAQARRVSGVYGKQSRQDSQLFLGVNKTRPVAFLARSGGLWSLSSFLSFLDPFFPYASRVCAPADARVSVACCLLLRVLN